MVFSTDAGDSYMTVTSTMMVFIALGMLGMIISKRDNMRRGSFLVQIILFSVILVVALGQATHVF